MPDPRSLRIDVGPVALVSKDPGRWTVESTRDGGSAAASGISAGWNDWVALAHAVLRADALWREAEARGDGWDEGFAAGRADGAAANPYR